MTDKEIEEYLKWMKANFRAPAKVSDVVDYIIPAWFLLTIIGGLFISEWVWLMMPPILLLGYYHWIMVNAVSELSTSLFIVIKELDK